MTPRAKVLLVGIDAGDPGLLRGWARDGTAPVLGALVDRGTCTTVENPPGLFSGSTWPSFYTGLHPGHHGRHASARFHSDTYASEPFDPYSVRGEPLWDALSRLGKRIAVIDVPRSCASRRLNGVQLVDWGAHAPVLEFCTVPAEFALGVTQRYGIHPAPRYEMARRTIAECREFRDALLSGVRIKTRLCKDLLEANEWDLFLVVFGESHDVGHQCWHLHDPSHRLWNAEVAAAVGDPVRDVYLAIDAAIGLLAKCAGPGVEVIVYSNNGMAPLCSATHLLDEVLLSLERADDTNLGTRMPRAVRRWLGRRPERRNRRYFQIFTNESSGGVRINLAGRESRGRIQPGAEYEAVCAALTSDLEDLVDSSTGRRVVRRIVRPRELYPGPEVDGLPDLIVEWNAGGPIDGVESPKIGTLRKSYSGPRTGDHTPEGVCVAAGPSIENLGSRIHVADLASWVGRLLGASIISKPEPSSLSGMS